MAPTPSPRGASPLPFFAALCMFLSAVEFAVPKPLPFLRLGLANLPVMVAVKKLRARDVLALLGMKIAAQALVGGTLFSYIFVFSLAGSAASGLCMLAAWRLLGRRGWISNVGLALAGAMANNGAQLLCARALVFGENTRYIAPLLLAAGLLTGVALGLFANRFEAQSAWFAQCGLPRAPQPPAGGRCPPVNTLSTGADGCSRPVDKPGKRRAYSLPRFFAALCGIAVMVVVHNLYVLWGTVFLFLAADCIVRRGKVRVLPSLLLTASVTALHLLSPYGRVLFRLGAWRITAGAAAAGLRRSGVLAGMVFASQFAVSGGVALPGRMGAVAASVMAVFGQLTARRIAFQPGRIIAAIDARLVEIWNRPDCP